MSPVEIIAAVATLINVYLTAKNNIWCWICGIIAVVLYGYVFYVSHLYSSMGLQALYYLPMQFYGWWVWLRCGPLRKNDLPIVRLSRRDSIFWFGINLPLAALLGYLMTFTGAELNYADALVTAMSVIAQYLLTHKYIENWVLWIMVDILYAFYLLPTQGLYVSAVLYLILLFLATWGFVEWMRIMGRQRVREPAVISGGPSYMAKRGLVIGKFYPPHRGHKHLIDVASSQVDDLFVIVCRRANENPPGTLRAAWLKEIHPNVNVMLVDDELDADDSQAWAEHSLAWLGFRPDVVFTSEDYGLEYAKYLICEHVMVDRLRCAVPISGTRIRSNPLSCWEYLEPPVRAYYAKRVCLVGAESTGKTTLAQRLAEHYQTVWVPEYGREYSELKLAADGCYNWRTEEFTHIATTQYEREDQAARDANKVLICDTDAFATGIWHQRYMGNHSRQVEAIAAKHRRPDLYLLTSVDVPFFQDGTRDGESIRGWMHEKFVNELTAQGRPFRQISGTPQEQFSKSVMHLDEVMGNSTSME